MLNQTQVGINIKIQLPAIYRTAFKLLTHLGNQEATAAVTGFFLNVRAGLAGLDAALDRERVCRFFKLFSRHLLGRRWIKGGEGAGAGRS